MAHFGRGHRGRHRLARMAQSDGRSNCPGGSRRSPTRAS
jgi:hypothetical protein